MLTSHSRNGSQAQQQLQQQLQQQQQQQQQQHLEIQKKHAKAERVRKLWTEFEQWLKHPRNEMERVRDHMLLQTANLNTVKISRRRIEEAYFSKAREEWQRRLRAVDLKESDWDPMNQTEMKAVEEALGVDDEEGYITDPSPSPPHRPFYAVASTPSAVSIPLVPAENLANRSSSSLAPGPSMLVAPPMTSASRATSNASSSSYECVKPSEFHSDDEESASDSEFSFSTTISSIISEEDEVVGPVTEYMVSQALEADPYIGVRPSTEVAKESNGPLLARSVPVPKPVDARAGSQPPPSLAPPKRPPDARQQPQSTTTSRSSSSSSSASVSNKVSPPAPTQSAASTKPSLPVLPHSAAPTTAKSSPPVASTSTATSSLSSSKLQQQSSKPSRVHYPLVAPSLSDLSDYEEVENDAESDRLSPSLVAQFEAQFEARKLEIRIEKIQRFHELASEADVALSISIADGRRDHTLSRQGEAVLVQRHYENTVALRDRMEKERKEQVNEEKKGMREEYVWRSSSSNQRHHGSLLQQQRPQPPAESDSDDDQMFERMRQEQLALQVQFNSHELPKAQVTRKRPSTLTLDSMPTPTVAMNDKNLDEVSTPRPASKSGWSVKPPGTRTVANVLGQSLSRKPSSPLFEPAVQQQQQSFFQEAENGELEANYEDADNEKERENTGFWSYLTKKKVANAAQPQSPQPQWNFSTVTKSSQKPTTAKSRLGIVTSAWDDDDFDADGKESFEEVVAEKEVEKEELPQEKTPVIPSAPAPNVSPANKKQTKKQRQTNKKGGAAGAASSVATTAKAEKAEVPPAPAPASSSNTQKGSKAAPVGAPGKPGKKSLDSDDISSTPRPNVLKRLQAQLTNEESFNEQDDEPTTPRPPAAKKVAGAWARKTMNKNVVDPAFDDDVTVDSTPGAASSNQMNGKNMTEAVASSPQAPGAWSWGTTTANDKAKAPAEAPSTTAVAGSRKNSGPARQAAINGVDNTEAGKKKGKKAQRSGVNANASGNATSGASNSAWSIKKTTVEEVPDDEADDLHPGSQVDKLLPHNSRSVLEEMRSSPFDFEEQPRIHEPRPSKPRAVFENIFQYEPAPDLGLVHALQDELPWSEERIAQAVARMAQDSHGLNGLNGANGLNGTNGYSPGSMNNGMGMNGAGHVNMATMNRVNMSNMNGSVTAVNGFGLSNPASAAIDATTTTTKKQVRWQPQQQQPQPQPSSFVGFDDHPRSQPLPPQAFVNKMAAVSRSYEGDEAFSPLAGTNGGFSGFQSSSSLSSSSSYAPFGGRNTKMNGLSQFGGNHHPFGDIEPEGNELDRAAHSLFENLHGSQQRNKPGFSAV